MKKRVIAVLLTLLMLLGMMPFGAFAETAETGKIKVVFICDPEDASVKVRPKETEQDPKPKTIRSEEDGYWLLAPGNYVYTASAEGFVKAEKIPFIVSSDVPVDEKNEKTIEIRVELLPEDPCADGHTFEQAVTDPTCTQAGSVTYTCWVCGESYTEEGAAALGHDYVPEVTEPTCTEAGYTIYTCSRCGDSYTEEGEPALGHDYVPEVTEPTCTEAGHTTYTCSRCGDSYAEEGAAAIGHDYVPEVTEPTCMEAGYTTYTCSRCGDSYTEEGEPAPGHDYVPEETLPATVDAEGVMTYTCSSCGNSYTETIPKLPPVEPETETTPVEPEPETTPVEPESETTPVEPEADVASVVPEVETIPAKSETETAPEGKKQDAPAEQQTESQESAQVTNTADDVNAMDTAASQGAELTAEKSTEAPAELEKVPGAVQSSAASDENSDVASSELPENEPEGNDGARDAKLEIQNQLTDAPLVLGNAAGMLNAANNDATGESGEKGTGKTDIQLTVTIEGWTYGEDAKAPVVSGNLGKGEETIEYKLKNAGDDTWSKDVPTNAGEYTVRVRIAETEQYNAGSATADFTIAKATPEFTVTAAPVTDEPGRKITLRRSGKDTSDKVPGSFKLEEGLRYGTNTYHWTFTPEDTGNYETTTGTVEITYSHVWKEPEFTWMEGNSGAIAIFVCENNETHKQSAKATVTSKVILLPTAQADGTIEYTASATVDGKTYTEDKSVTVPRAKADSYSNTGNAPVWTAGSKEPATVRIVRSAFDEITYDAFVSVSVDGSKVDAGKYSVEPGSAVIKLQPEYLSTLSTGEHKLTAVFSDGTAETTLKIQESTPETCTVSFDVKGHGTAPAAQTVESGKTATQPDNPTAEGYTFSGWYSDSACTAAYSFTTPVTQNTTLYAGWTEATPASTETYKVSFQTNGGTAIPTQEVDGGKTAAQPDEPTRGGYVFCGWYTEQACTNAYDFKTPVTAHLTLYAKWLKVQPAAPVVNEGAPSITAENLSEIAASVALTDEEKEKAQAGDSLKIWLEIGVAKTAKSNDLAALRTKGEELGFQGRRWLDIKLLKQVGKNDAVEVHETDPAVKFTVTVPADLQKDGRIFSLVRAHNGQATVIVDATTKTKLAGESNVFSTYLLGYRDAQNSYTVSFNTQGHGTAPASQTVQAGEYAKEPTTDPSAEGYVFKGWYTDSSYTTRFDFEKTPINQNTVIYAGWNRLYTVSFSMLGHGTAPASQTVESGRTATRPSNPTADGYAFRGWYVDEDCTTLYNFATPVRQNLRLYAKWVRLYRVVFSANGHGTAPSAQTVMEGSTVSRPTNPTANYYSFDGWYTDQACQDEYDFSTPVTQNMVLYAKWTYTGKGPKTGDEANTGLWIALACVGAAGLVGTGMALKKRKKK